MDSVGVERAGLEKDLDETKTEIRRLKERFDDAAGSKLPVLEQLHIQLRQLEERRVRLEENLKHLGESRPGGLPSTQSGSWSPLVLHEWKQVPVPADWPRTPDFVAPVPRPVPAVSRGETDREALLREIAEVVQLGGAHHESAVNRLKVCMAKARDDAPMLRLLGAAFDAIGNTWQSYKARARAETLGAAPAPAPVPVPPTVLPLPPMPAPETLPDARDGLTRMERMVLSAMYALWFRADGPMKKTAVLVEELRLNDASVTAAEVDATLAQLTQPWSRRNPLVEVAGPVCRLTALAEELFTDLEKDVVDFEAGCSFKLPCVLPAPFPLLLAKGTDGFPPHVLSDLIGAASYLLQFPRTTAYELASALRGPDLPNGGVVDHDSLPWAYTGRPGRLTMRASLEIQKDLGSQRARIIATELPWPLEKAEVLKQLQELKLEGVSGISDQSTDTEDRLVIEIEHAGWVRQVSSILKKCGALRHSRAIELRINEEGESTTASALTVLDLFLGHRRSVVTRRLRYDLRKLQAQAHRIEGLLVATEVLDLIAAVIIDADDPAESFWGLTHLASPELTTRVSFAKRSPLEPERLRNAAAHFVTEPSHRYVLGFSEEQARAILGTRRLASLQKDELLREWTGLAQEIARVNEPLQDVRALEAVILDELAAQRDHHAGVRRSSFEHMGG